MKLLVISNEKTDLYNILSSACETEIISPSSTENLDFSGYSAIAILGGTQNVPLVLNGYLRCAVEQFADSGKPVFTEYLNSFRCVYSAGPVFTAPHRLVVAEGISGLEAGDLLDSHYNSYIHPHFLMPDTKILLYYKQYTPAHLKLKEISADDAAAMPAVFRYGNILSVAFRMCNMAKALFSPKDKWLKLVNYICSFLGIPNVKSLPDYPLTVKGEISQDLDSVLDCCIENGIKLLKNHLVTEDGRRGIYEGISHNIYPDGTRIQAPAVRADCTGEAAGAFLFSEKEELKSVGENMLEFCYGPLTVHGGEFDGMMRWTEEAWNVCYQDDVARAIIPSLLLAYFKKSDKFAEKACKSLEFLCETSGKDGLRPARTDVLEFIRENKPVSSLKNIENGFKSGHYNSWYSAALLLGYLVSGNEKFKETGIKGLEAIMGVYPETVREHSETSELCRLIFPLAVLYTVTGEKKHLEWLEDVYQSLKKHRHQNGGYREWDTGYKATCFNNAGGECSLLSENGDNVSDLLYSANWLPLGFAFAYHATGNTEFKNAWEDICKFFASTQIVADNKMLNGGWCRGIDLDTREYHGIPHDVGWGPCSLETGWTVSEILTGMLIGRKLCK